jgi:hypothetical protein
VTPGRIQRWLEAIRSQATEYAFTEALGTGDVLRAPAPAPTLEVLATATLAVTALRIHSVQVRAAATVDDPDGVPIHVLRLIAILADGDEVEVLREAIAGESDHTEAQGTPQCTACGVNIWDHDVPGQAIAIDGQLYHRGCVIGEADDNG